MLLCRNNLLSPEQTKLRRRGEICLRPLYDFLLWGNYHHPKLGPLVLLKECLSKVRKSQCLQFSLHLEEIQDYEDECGYKMHLEKL